MKLSFSFTKTAPPKRPVFIPVQPEEPDNKREVVEISSTAGVIVEKTAEDIEAEKSKTFVIPVKSYRTESKSDTNGPPILPEGSLVSMESTPGIIAGDTHTTAPSVGIQHVAVGAKKPKTSSVLMRIREAKLSGAVHDAPDQDNRTYDPEDFGWALMRGMGYDPSTDTSPDVTKDVIGNRVKRGLGVKPEHVGLPTDVVKPEK
jgi:hypothetical protein